jgi:hypothetical protein
MTSGFTTTNQGGLGAQPYQFGSPSWGNGPSVGPNQAQGVFRQAVTPQGQAPGGYNVAYGTAMPTIPHGATNTGGQGPTAKIADSPRTRRVMLIQFPNHGFLKFARADAAQIGCRDGRLYVGDKVVFKYNFTATAMKWAGQSTTGAAATNTAGTKSQAATGTATKTGPRSNKALSFWNSINEKPKYAELDSRPEFGDDWYKSFKRYININVKNIGRWSPDRGSLSSSTNTIGFWIRDPYHEYGTEPDMTSKVDTLQHSPNSSQN